jgi:hypothetical protein
MGKVVITKLAVVLNGDVLKTLIMASRPPAKPKPIQPLTAIANPIGIPAIIKPINNIIPIIPSTIISPLFHSHFKYGPSV